MNAVTKSLPLEGEVLDPAVEVDDAGFAVGARPLCPFCSKPWGDGMMDLFERCHVATGYYGDPEDIEATIDITCDGCNRTIYRKEVTVSAYHWRR
jgi:hypothetical protein